ncbi:DUF6961 family protein [Sphingobium yanoikuyae]|uniref:DUF6961 family protein n=1 Tax=Sphingobium yanoikuyae TaxID=13690 RepID=UPI0035B36A52
MLDGHGATARAYAASQIEQLEAAGDFVSASAWRSIAERIDLLIDQSGRELPTKHYPLDRFDCSDISPPILADVCSGLIGQDHLPVAPPRRQMARVELETRSDFQTATVLLTKAVSRRFRLPGRWTPHLHIGLLLCRWG